VPRPNLGLPASKEKDSAEVARTVYDVEGGVVAASLVAPEAQVPAAANFAGKMVIKPEPGRNKDRWEFDLVR
jgi:hypothetical protein